MVTAKELMIVKYPAVKSGDTISTFIGLIRKTHQHWAVVLDEKGRYEGMADKKLLMRSRIDVQKMKVRHCVVSSPILSQEDDLKIMLRKFLSSDVKALPVFNGKQLIGVVPVINVLNYFKPIISKVKAQEIMPKTLMTIKETESIGKVLNLMTQKKLHHVPVVDDGKLVGIISLEDILEKQLLFPKTRMHISGAASHQEHRQTGYGTGEKTSLMFCPASSLMSPDCCTCGPNDSLSKVIEQMLENKHGSAIIAKDKKPIGIITIKDILVKAQLLI